MRSGYLGNWDRGLLGITVVVLAVVVAMALWAMERIETTSAEMGLSVRRCVVDANLGLGLEGYAPVAECTLGRIDEIDLGPGVLTMGDGPGSVAREAVLVLSELRSSSIVTLTGDDLSLGRLSLGAGRMDIRCSGPGVFHLESAPYDNDAVSKGVLSLGASCGIAAVGYDLLIDGIVVPGFSDLTEPVVFTPHGGAADFTDTAGGFGLQFEIVDRDFVFDKPVYIGGIRFLNEDARCSGVNAGSIRVGKQKQRTDIPGDSCVRLAAERIEQRHLGLNVGATEIATSLSGQFSSVELNGTGLVARPVWRPVLIALGGLIVFGGFILVAKALLKPRGRSAGAGHAVSATASKSRALRAGRPLGGDRVEEGIDHIFISYDHSDRTYVETLAENMESKGFKAWTDREIDLGEEWQRILEERIETCAGMVFIMSREAGNSSWVRREVAHARRLGVEIIPLLLSGELILQMSTALYLDVKHGGPPAESFYTRLEKCLRQRRLEVAQEAHELELMDAEFAAMDKANITAYVCSGCSFPVPYDSMTGTAMALLLGVPVVGGAVLYYLTHWLGAALWLVPLFSAILFAVTKGEPWLKEPSVCRHCGTSLKKHLRRYIALS